MTQKIFRLLLFYLFPVVAFSQVDTVQFDEILIIGNVDDNLLKKELSGTAISIGSPHDVGEIFKREDGIGIVKRGNYAMEPVIRGFKYEQLNVQVNGGAASTSACPNRMDPTISQVTPEDIEKVELIKGPYSVRFGPNFGGVLNIVTRQPARTEQLKIKGFVNGGYQSNGGNYFSDLHIMATQRKFDLVLNGGYKDYGNYKSGDGDLISSSFRRYAYSMKLGVQPSDKQRIQVSWQQGFAKDVMHPGLPMDAEYDNSSLGNIDYHLWNLTKHIFSWKTKAFFSLVDHLMSNEGRKNYALVHSKTPVNATVFGGRTELGIKLTEDSFLFGGLDVKQTSKDGIRNRDVYKNPCNGMEFDPPVAFTEKVWQASSMNDFGIFLENKYKLSQRLRWILGARIDWVSYNINDPDEGFNEFYSNEIYPDDQINFSVNTTLNFQINDGFSLLWSAGKGVRSPELTELFINHFTVGMDAYEYLGNPNLKSEKNYQTDIRIEKEIKNTLVYAGVFYSYVKDFISAKVDTTIPRVYMPCMDPQFTKVFTNVDEVNLYGFEAGVDISVWESMHLALGTSYTFAHNITWDEPLQEIPPFMINTAVGYTNKQWSVNLKARTHAAQERIAESFGETTTPGFTVLDLYLTYQPWTFLEVYMDVTNMLDENYVEHLSRPYKNTVPDEIPPDGLYYEPGRSFNGGIRISF